MSLHQFLPLSSAIIMAGLLLTGCGLKGDLYLPEEPAASSQQQSSPSVEHNKVAPTTEDQATDNQITGS